MIREQSLLAYADLTIEKKTTRRETVLKAIRDNPCISDKQISRLTGLPINCVTPRRGELEKMGVIKSRCVIGRENRWVIDGGYDNGST
jgi:predicted transcriptional regulator